MNALFQSYGLVVASVLAGLATVVFIWSLITLIVSSRSALEGSGTFERHRRQQLRGGNTIFRLFEPLVEELAGIWGRLLGTSLESLRRDLVVSREKLPWRPEEFLAAKTIEGVLVGLAVAGILRILGFSTGGLVLGLGFAMFYPWMGKRSVTDRARRRLKRLRTRLPFSIDLISLMMEAGASFPESLETVVRENEGHPLGEEFGEVVRQIALGRSRAEALRGMQQRLANEDISELVFAINKGEELGTPITSVLRDQADQMRVKRSQWGEKAAGEAQVQLVFPGMVVMVACLLVVVAPIILPALLQYL